MSDDQTDPSSPSPTPTEPSTWRSQYLHTAVLGGLVFGVLPAAYYLIGLRAAALVTLITLFLLVYSSKRSD